MRKCEGISLYCETKIYAFTETVFKEKHGVWDPTPELTTTHIADYKLRSQLSIPTAKGNGGVGKISPIGIGISKTTNRTREITEKGQGRGES